jgi:hypothetical protein
MRSKILADVEIQCVLLTVRITECRDVVILAMVNRKCVADKTITGIVRFYIGVRCRDCGRCGGCMNDDSCLVR